MGSPLHVLSLSVFLLLTLPSAPSQAVSPPNFDVATIKLAKEATGSSSGIRTGRGELSAQNVTLKRCIIGAYGVGPHQILAGPTGLIAPVSTSKLKAIPRLIATIPS